MPCRSGIPPAISSLAPPDMIRKCRRIPLWPWTTSWSRPEWPTISEHQDLQRLSEIYRPGGHLPLFHRRGVHGPDQLPGHLQDDRPGAEPDDWRAPRMSGKYDDMLYLPIPPPPDTRECPSQSGPLSSAFSSPSPATPEPLRRRPA